MLSGYVHTEPHQQAPITKCNRNRKEYKDWRFLFADPVFIFCVLNREKASSSTSRCHQSFVTTRKEAIAECYLQLKANRATMKVDILQDEHKLVLCWHPSMTLYQQLFEQIPKLLWILPAQCSTSAKLISLVCGKERYRYQVSSLTLEARKAKVLATRWQKVPR